MNIIGLTLKYVVVFGGTMITKQTGLFGLREEFKPLVTELGRIVKITENGYEMLTKAGMKQVKGTFNLIGRAHV